MAHRNKSSSNKSRNDSNRKESRNSFSGSSRNDSKGSESASSNWRDKSDKSSSFNSQNGSRGKRNSSPYHSKSPRRRMSGPSDPEFLSFRQIIAQRSTIDLEKLKFTEIESDLFQIEKDYSLAHCVAADMGMGAGIAVQFRSQFGRVAELLDQRQSPGGLAILQDGDRFVYYLVTKLVSYGKPTMETLFRSLKLLQQHVEQNEVRKLAMPLIGCGLDGLDWGDVQMMIKYVFRSTDVEIVICNYRPSEPAARKGSAKVVHVAQHLKDIDEYTIILYFTDTKGTVSPEMEDLNGKFNFLADFRTQNKTLGSIIPYTKKQNYVVCGCVVKENCEVRFEALQRCAHAINKENKTTQFGFVAFQAEAPKVRLEAITNVLKHALRNVELYICYPPDVEDLMPAQRMDSSYGSSRNSYNDSSRLNASASSFVPNRSTESDDDVFYKQTSRTNKAEEGNDEEMEECIEKARIETNESELVLKAPVEFARVLFVTESIESVVEPAFSLIPCIGDLLMKRKTVGEIIEHKSSKTFYFLIVKKTLGDQFDEAVIQITLKQLLKTLSGKQIAIHSLPVKNYRNIVNSVFDSDNYEIHFMGPKTPAQPTEVKKITRNMEMVRKNVIALYFANETTFPAMLDKADKKFELKRTFDKERKTLGVLVEHRKVEERYLFGCIIIESGDRYNFVALQHCLKNIRGKEITDVNCVAFVATPNVQINRKIASLIKMVFSSWDVMILCPDDLENAWP